jgi:hypothetical protein
LDPADPEGVTIGHWIIKYHGKILTEAAIAELMEILKGR